MSWFEKDLAAVLEFDDDCAVTDYGCDEEVAEGVFVERRSVLWLSAAAVTSVLAGSSTLAAQDKGGTQKPPAKPRTDELTFAQFLAEVYPLAQKVVAKGQGDKGEEAYLLSVAAAMSRLAEPDANLRQAMQEFRKQHRGDGGRFPISATALRLRAGRGFSHHDHRNYNGVIMGLAGEVRIRNYDILGDVAVPPQGKTFQIRETRDDLILPGRFSTLACARENVHDLVAGPDGGRVLDVFTFFGSGAGSHFMDVEKKPRDAARRIYDAAWKSRRRRGRK